MPTMIAITTAVKINQRLGRQERIPDRPDSCLSIVAMKTTSLTDSFS